MEHKHVEYLILGAGPAGIQLGYFLERDKRDYIILERGKSAGSSFNVFPKHRKLISINKIFTGENEPELKLRHDWNSLLSDDYKIWFSKYDKNYFPHPDNLCRYLRDFALEYEINIQFDISISNVSKKGNGYLLRSECGQQISCDNLIVATGVGKPYIPEIKGIELVTQYRDMTTSLSQYENKSILVIGKGNSGFETADHLISVAKTIHICSPTSLKLAWQTHFVGNLRAVNNNFLDTYQLKSQNAVLDAEIVKIEIRNNKLAVTFRYLQAQGEIEEILYDNVICCTGFQLDTSIFEDECMPLKTINDRLPALTCEWESVNMSNMFFVGTLMQMRDYKKANSGFIHGFRYNIKAFNKILVSRNHDEEWSAETIPFNSALLAKQILRNVNDSGALWQQSEFICDFYSVNEKLNEVYFYSEIPKDYAVDKFAKKNASYLIVTLEFGAKVQDPFNAKRPAGDDTVQAYTSNFLHPVIREYRFGKLISEHHIIENLFGEWKLFNQHILPLEEYLESIFRIKPRANRLEMATPVNHV